MSTRSGRRRRLLDGKLVEPDHERAPCWEELVQAPASQPPHERSGAHYAALADLPTPDSLAVQDPKPESFKGMSRRDRRAKQRAAKQRMRRLRASGVL